ncbi:MAG TPA: glycosyltransferase, partial [Flavisolibacter sp.]|nr:glycosyltransferase [Flavisolibacter sp.]
MTIFILIDWFHPAYKAGGPVQSIANLVHQFYEGVQYKIFCSNKDLDEKDLPVPVDQWVKYNQVTDVWYSKKKTLYLNELKKQLKTNPDAVLFINGIYSWNFNVLPIFSKAGRKIVSARGMLHAGALSQKSLKKKIYLTLWKMLGFQHKVEFHASTVTEKEIIQKVFGRKTKVHIASNFPRIFNKQQVLEKRGGNLHLISIGIISPMKNHLLVLQALQACEAKITYHIYGSIKDDKYWLECQKVIRTIPENISVQYHGDVQPDKVEDVLTESHVFILPSKSENFGHAIFEALSAGKPVITSMATPWNGLKEKCAGINVLPDEPREIAAAISFFADMGQQ